MDYNADDGTCSCRNDELVMNSQGTRCYNGIDLNFDSEYNCNDSTEQIFTTLTDDLSIAWGSKGTESVNCDKFGETVVEISMQTGVIGANAGTEATMIPSSLTNDDPREATLVFEVYLDDDMVMPWTMSFPGFWIQGPTWFNFQPYAKGGNMLFKGKPDACSFCDSISSYATIEPGQWYKVEQRIKLNDQNQANGEYIILWNDVEVVRETGLAEMVPNDGDYFIDAYKLWTTIDWPAAENESKIYYRQITGKKFESNGSPHVTTPPATTTYPITTTPAPTTTTESTTTTTPESTTPEATTTQGPDWEAICALPENDLTANFNMDRGKWGVLKTMFSGQRSTITRINVKKRPATGQYNGAAFFARKYCGGDFLAKLADGTIRFDLMDKVASYETFMVSTRMMLEIRLMSSNGVIMPLLETKETPKKTSCTLNSSDLKTSIGATKT